MRYERLFDVQIRHAAYPAGRSSELQLVPSVARASGVRALARHRLLSRPRPLGLEVTGQAADLQPAIAFGQLTLSFDLRVLGTDFTSLTDLSAWSNIAAPILRVAPDHDGKAGGPLQVSASAPGVRHPVGVAAVVEIVANPAWHAAPPTFTFEFEAREVLWAYYLVTSRPKGATPRIQDGDSKHPLTFVRKQLTLANTSASVDPIGRRMLERYPDRRCFRMLSKRQLAVQRTARRQLALYLGDELLIRELATPSIHSFTSITRTSPELRDSSPPDRGTSEPNSLYRVVEY